MDTAFFPGARPAHPEPLSIFVPPYREGLGREFLRRLGGPGIRIVDPFGQSPALALEMARAGAAVLVACSNPVVRALLALQANPPPSSLLRGVWQRLAQSPSASHGETVETLLRGLYRTECVRCGRAVEADGYIWNRAAEDEPYRLVRHLCHCPHCDHACEEEAVPADAERVQPYLRPGVYYHLALEKLAAPDSPDRSHMIEALDVYPPRALYALFTVMTRLEAMSLEPAERRCGDLLMLAALDEGHMLRGHAHAARPRPRSLQLPAEYREWNIWRVLERAVEEWSLPAETVPLRRWKPGDPLEEGVLSLSGSNARDLAPQLPDIRPDAIITFLPRPNQAAWTLAAMWAGWLWGRPAAAALAGVLHRRRYDWNWHARALSASTEALAAHLPYGIPLAALIGESEPGFLAAAIWSFYQSGFSLQGLALRADSDFAQMVWRAPRAEHAGTAFGTASFAALEEVGRLAARRLISWRAEPTPWELLHAAAWSEAAYRHMLPPAARGPEEENGFSRCQAALHNAVENDPELVNAGHEESDLGQTWWLPGAELVANPLSDQVETEVARLLLEAGPIRAEEMDSAICAQFPGLLTPEARLMRACQASYGEWNEDARTWSLRAEDRPEARLHEVESIRHNLLDLAARLGLHCIEDVALEWLDARGRRLYRFFVISSAAIGRYLLDAEFEPECSCIVVPGGRAALVEYKLRRNPRLHRAVESGWRFLKFRHVRRLMEDSLLSQDTLDQRLNLDPLGAHDDQISFL
jgi:hypothetical protein